MSDRDELAALRRMAELEAKAGGVDLAGIKKDGSHPTPAEYKPPVETQPRDYMGEMSAKRDAAPYETGAKVNDWLAAKGVPAPFAAGLGAATNVGMVGGEMVAGAGAGAPIGTAMKPALETGARWSMIKALRPIWEEHKKGRVEEAAITMLDKGLNPTVSGVSKINQQVAALKADERAITDVSQNYGNADAIIDSLTPFKAKAQQATLHTGPVATADAVKQEFLTNPNILTSKLNAPGGTSDIPVPILQNMKEANYRMLGDSAFGKGLNPDPRRDALKKLTNGIRTQIEAAEPGVVPLTAEMSRLLNAKNVAERRALMELNKDPAALKVALALASHNPLLAAGMWANGSAYAKSMFARALRQGSNYGTEIGAAAGASVPAALQMNQGE